MDTSELQNKALWVRNQALEMQAKAGKGHLGGAFSVTDLLVAIYYSEIFKTSYKWWNKLTRDRVFFSKGHAALALYPILADQGFFPEKELMKYGENGTILGGHPDHFIPGVEASTGSLGHGLGVAAGFALSAKLNEEDVFSIAILGDGECNEGSVWEAALFGRQQSLGNLVAVIDNNGVGATDFTSRYLGPDSMAKKWDSFGWDIMEIDGHNFDEILQALEKIRIRKLDKPVALVAKTVKGKGVSFMENDYHWHHGVPNTELLEVAREELKLN